MFEASTLAKSRALLTRKGPTCGVPFNLVDVNNAEADEGVRKKTIA